MNQVDSSEDGQAAAKWREMEIITKYAELEAKFKESEAEKLKEAAKVKQLEAEIERKVKQLEAEIERLKEQNKKNSAADTKGPIVNDNSLPEGAQGGGLSGGSNENSMMADTRGAAKNLRATDAQHPWRAKVKEGRLIFGT